MGIHIWVLPNKRSHFLKCLWFNHVSALWETFSSFLISTLDYVYLFIFRSRADRERLILRAGGEGPVCDWRGVLHGPRSAQHAQGSLSWKSWPLLQDGFHKRHNAAQVHPRCQIHRSVHHRLTAACVCVFTVKYKLFICVLLAEAASMSYFGLSNLPMSVYNGLQLSGYWM